MQSTATSIKNNLAAPVNVSVSPAVTIPLVGSMVGSSSRGPSMGQMFYGNNIMYSQLIKPEIGAPGASISALVGTGSGTEPFGGTSGAAPMVAGAGALLRAYTWQAGQLAAGPLELKSWLMNTGNTEIYTVPAATGGALAPITRIGGGEVRIERGLGAQVMAYELNNRAGALSFGMHEVARTTLTLRRTVVVRNMSNKRVTLNIAPTFRYAADQASGAVTVSAH